MFFHTDAKRALHSLHLDNSAKGTICSFWQEKKTFKTFNFFYPLYHKVILFYFIKPILISNSVWYTNVHFVAFANRKGKNKKKISEPQRKTPFSSK